MRSTLPPLLRVELALPPRIQRHADVVHLLNDFLIPPAIDSAVYNELHLVVRVYGSERPWTTAAMDGAAARGNDRVMQRLHTYRPEGCSGQAFLEAAANNHLKVLKLLYDYYPALSNPHEEVVVAATAGHARIVRFLQPKLHFKPYRAIKAAASNGNVDVLLALNLDVEDLPLQTAAANGHTPMVHDMLIAGFDDRYSLGNALVDAASGGHRGVVDALLGKGIRAHDVGYALEEAARNGHTDVVSMLLERGQPSKEAITSAFWAAQTEKQLDAVRLLLEAIPHVDFTKDASDCCPEWEAANNCIVTAFRVAISTSNVELVSLLVDRIHPCYMDPALTTAMLNYRVDIMELLFKAANERKPEHGFEAGSVTSALERAVAMLSVEMTEVLCRKCSTIEPGRALMSAVLQNDLDMVKLLVLQRNLASVGEALVCAVETNQPSILEHFVVNTAGDILELAMNNVVLAKRFIGMKQLLENCNRPACTEVFENAAKCGHLQVVKVLLDKTKVH